MAQEVCHRERLFRYSKTDASEEATWGADPLEYLGGFRTLRYNRHDQYHSSLATNGTVKWAVLEGETRVATKYLAEVKLEVGFSEVDWKFLQSFYGWAALQYQGWARGYLCVNGIVPRTVLLYIDNVLEFYVDMQPYFGGDFYAYRKSPLVLHLYPGRHTIDVRILRDVRAMGAVGLPIVDIVLRAEISTESLVIVADNLVLPEIAGGRLSSDIASVPLRNQAQKWIRVLAIESTDVCLDKNPATPCC